MRSLRDQGVVSAIGLGVNEVAICAESLKHVDLDILMIAGRHTLLHQDAVPFMEACRLRGIGIAAAGIYNSGILATGTTTAQPFYDYQPAPGAIIRRVKAMEECCAEFGVPLAAAALQFVLAHPAITATMVGAASAWQVNQTLALSRHSIPSLFWETMAERGLMEAGAITSPAASASNP